jgi:hypothetical protein
MEDDIVPRDTERLRGRIQGALGVLGRNPDLITHGRFIVRSTPFPQRYLIASRWETIMQAPILAGLAIFLGVETAAHADCVGSICLPDQQPMRTQPNTELSLERRIENALNDLEVYNARASTTNLEPGDTLLENRISSALKDLETATTRTLRTDQERRNALLRKTGIER